jgi:anti-sigma factor RsiW
VNCRDANLLINAYADGELDAARTLELEQHVQSCAECKCAWENIRALKKSLKQDALYFAAPADLRQRIKASLPSPAKEISARAAWSWNWLTTAFSGAFAVCLALLLTMTIPHGQENRLADEIVSEHVRSMMANHVMDVVSTDQHTVKPWFNGKVDFSPPVRDLAAQDFPLIGGRLDYLNGRNVAALIFQHHKHIINLFIWPSKQTSSQPAALPSRQGFHLVHWSDGDMIYWAVSDLNEAELMDFAHAFNTASH